MHARIATVVAFALSSSQATTHLWGVGGEPGNMASFYTCHERQYLAGSGSVYKTPVLHDRYCERRGSVQLKCMRCIVEGYSRRLANTADCHVILLKRVEQKNGGWQILTVC